jgi:ribonucleoside-diphosphate reductase alpha chain
MNALEQLEFWKKFKENYTDHNPSVTIYVKDEEWLEVGAWVYKNWDVVGGLSFLPYDGGIYTLSPYEEINKEKYEELVAKFPNNIDFNLLTNYEKDDYTTGAKEYACVGGACEIN